MIGQYIHFGDNRLYIVCKESFLRGIFTATYYRAINTDTQENHLIKLVDDVNVGLGEIEMYFKIQNTDDNGQDDEHNVAAAATAAAAENEEDQCLREPPTLSYTAYKLIDKNQILLCLGDCDIDLHTLFGYCAENSIRLNLKNILLPIWLGIFKNLHYLHQRHIIHGNLKLTNVVLTNGGTVKFINFEQSYKIAQISSFTTQSVFEEFQQLNEIIEKTLTLSGYTQRNLDSGMQRIFRLCMYNRATLATLVHTTEAYISKNKAI